MTTAAPKQITNIKQAGFCGEFHIVLDGGKNTQYVGQIIKVADRDYRICKVKEYGNGEVIWCSAPFTGREFKKLSSFGGLTTYTIR